MNTSNRETFVLEFNHRIEKQHKQRNERNGNRIMKTLLVSLIASLALVACGPMCDNTADSATSDDAAIAQDSSPATADSGPVTQDAAPAEDAQPDATPVPDVTCTAGMAPEVCGGVCVDTYYDTNNCGSCGTVCAYPNGFTRCGGGECLVLGCMQGYSDLDGIKANGCEHLDQSRL